MIFLILNGQTINHSEDDAYKTMHAVAGGSITKQKLAGWLRDGMIAR